MNSIIRTRLFLMIFSGIIVISLSSSLLENPESEAAKKINILVITGGHDFNPEFFDVFRSFGDISFDTITQPRANDFLCTAAIGKYDALVFYDMWQNISDIQKAGYMNLFKSGKGMVFLHHSIVSYENWNEFHQALGGTYYLENNKFHKPPSDYKHDLEIPVTIDDPDHFITRGVKDFVIHDEGYKNFSVAPGVQVLLSANHPDSDKNIAWTNHYLNSDIVYLMLGHDEKAYANDNYRRLLHNSILWVSHHTGQ